MAELADHSPDIGAAASPHGRGRGPLALTMGDPAGIGLDIVIEAVTATGGPPIPPLVAFADPDALEARARLLGRELPVAVVAQPEDAGSVPPGTLPVIATPLAAGVQPGVGDPANGPAVIAAIERAVAAVADGSCAAIVTNPISKATLYAAGFRHPGHTEFLAELAGRHWPGQAWVPVMMLASDMLRVVPLTVHIPLAQVPAAISGDLIATTVAIMARDLASRFGIPRPRIAVAGLNPHAGEGGSIGREDAEIIAPALAVLRAKGFDILGPLPADTMFHAAARARYDAALCMYHDQALIPLKTLAFDDGVNVTLGLPFVRTSPDHGTAFDIAGSGKARPTSLIAALHMAARMSGLAPVGA